jgi:hypothetical protein
LVNCNNQQNKAKQLLLGGSIIGKKTTTTTPGSITIEATSRQPRKLIFGMQPYSNPTRRNRDDDLNNFEHGRRPHFKKEEDYLNFFEYER